MKFNLKKILVGDDLDTMEPMGIEGEEETNEMYTNENDYAPVRPAHNNAGVSMSSGSSIEMKVIKPEGFESAKQIADLLLSKKTVLLNLEDTNKETARRLIDFLSGIAYAINGDLNRVANNTFVIAPQNVKVSDEQISENLDNNQ